MCSYFILNKALNLQLRNLLGTTCLLHVILTNCSQLPGKLHLHWPNKHSSCIFFPTEIVTAAVVFTVWTHIHYQSVLLNLETPQKLCWPWLLPYAFPSCASPLQRHSSRGLLSVLSKDRSSIPSPLLRVLLWPTMTKWASLNHLLWHWRHVDIDHGCVDTNLVVPAIPYSQLLPAMCTQISTVMGAFSPVPPGTLSPVAQLPQAPWAL